MYTFTTLRLCASVAPPGTWKGQETQPWIALKMSPIEFITPMYNRSVTMKAFKERNYILAPGTELNTLKLNPPRKII